MCPVQKSDSHTKSWDLSYNVAMNDITPDCNLLLTVRVSYSVSAYTHIDIQIKQSDKSKALHTTNLKIVRCV